MEREYGVVLSSRGRKVCVRVTANTKVEAHKAVKAAIPSYRVGRFGGNAYSGSYVNRLANFASHYVPEFITLAEASERIAQDGFVETGVA